MVTILWIIMVWFMGPILLGAFRCFKAGLVGEAIYRLVAAAGVVLILYTMISRAMHQLTILSDNQSPLLRKIDKESVNFKSI